MALRDLISDLEARFFASFLGLTCERVPAVRVQYGALERGLPAQLAELACYIAAYTSMEAVNVRDNFHLQFRSVFKR